MPRSTLTIVRGMRWLATGLFLSLLAEQIVLFAVPLIIYERSRSLTYSGAAFALEWLPALAAYPFAGLLADRIGGGRLYRLANVSRASFLFVALFATWLCPYWTVPILMINGVMLSVLIAPNRMAIQKTIATTGPVDEMAHRQSMLQNIELLCMAMGAGTAAALAQLLGKLPLFAVAAVSFLVAVWCWRNVQFTQTRPRSANSVMADLLQGWQLLFANNAVILLAVINFGINYVFAVVLSGNPSMIKGTFAVSDYILGAMGAGAGLLGLINLVLVPEILKRWSINYLGVGGFVVLGAGLISMSLGSVIWIYVTGYFIAMAGVTLFNVFNRSERVKAIGDEHLGKVSGAFYLINGFSYPLGGMTVALLGPVYGVQHVLLIISLILLAIGGALLAMAINGFVAQQYRRKLLNQSLQEENKRIVFNK